MTPALAWEIQQRSGEHLRLGAANTVPTIPSLALFGLLLTVPLLGGIGPWPCPA